MIQGFSNLGGFIQWFLLFLVSDMISLMTGGMYFFKETHSVPNTTSLTAVLGKKQIDNLLVPCYHISVPVLFRLLNCLYIFFYHKHMFIAKFFCALVISLTI